MKQLLFFAVSLPYHDRAHRKYCCNTGFFCAAFSVIERVRKAFLIIRKAIFNVTEASRMFGGKFGCVKRINNIDTELKVRCCVFGSTRVRLVQWTRRNKRGIRRGHSIFMVFDWEATPSVKDERQRI
jgi:hypothetical protein